jgi:UDP-N-acetylmuramyl pentapeptide phosphotransferase/UDP-N-acetylglucosamine-1-phosphate transferase
VKPRGGEVLAATLSATLSAAAAGLAAGGAARAAYALLKKYPPGGAKTWTRTNHRGEPVTLLEGPAVALGAIAVQIFYPERTMPAHMRQSIALAGAGALGFGVLDDLAGSGKRRGLRGHLGALAHGEVTTGAVKLAGIGATGVGSALLMSSQPADVVINSGLIAAGANLLNLFDLRPGRAIKVTAGSAALIGLLAAPQGGAVAPVPPPHGGTARPPIPPWPPWPPWAAPAGAALALLPADLGERAMLGDAGANALGAMLGAAAASCLPRPARVALLAGMVALTGASEKISFTKVIERTPPLRWLDMLGRRPRREP